MSAHLPVPFTTAEGTDVLVNPAHVAVVWPIPGYDPPRCRLEFASTNTEFPARTLTVMGNLAAVGHQLAYWQGVSQ